MQSEQITPSETFNLEPFTTLPQDVYKRQVQTGGQPLQTGEGH